jgi:hypothetical protein
VPKYYVDFGKEYRIVTNASHPKEACVKCLRLYLEKDTYLTTESDTLTVPDKFRVSERGFPNFSHVNNDDYHEFSHEQISKLLNKGSGGNEPCLA